MIIRSKGRIGLNFFAPFIHNTDPIAILRHVECSLALGAENTLSFGADFFCDVDLPNFLQTKYNRKEAYYPDFSNSSAYPRILQLFSEKLKLTDKQLLKIASENALRSLREKAL